MTARPNPNHEWIEAVRLAKDDLAARVLADPASSDVLVDGARRHLATSRPFSEIAAEYRALSPAQRRAMRERLFPESMSTSE